MLQDLYRGKAESCMTKTQNSYVNNEQEKNFATEETTEQKGTKIYGGDKTL